VVSEEDIQAIALKLKELALAGNLAAIRLLFSYVIGRPQAATNPDTLDLQEWSQLRQAPAMLEEMPKVTQCLTPEHACFLARNAQPLVSEEILKQFDTELQERNEEDARDNEQQLGMGGRPGAGACRPRQSHRHRHQTRITAANRAGKRFPLAESARLPTDTDPDQSFCAVEDNGVRHDAEVTAAVTNR
jgi:hypothetical protein